MAFGFSVFGNGMFDTHRWLVENRDTSGRTFDQRQSGQADGPGRIIAARAGFVDKVGIGE